MSETTGELAAGEAHDVEPFQVPQDTGVSAMLMTAINRGHEPATLEKLMDLYERLEAKQAAQAFADAMHRFQSSVPVIQKNRTAGSGRFTYDYATLDAIAAAIRPHLAAAGLSYTFDATVDAGVVTVLCRVRHSGGHMETSTFSAPIDKGASMNDTQKVGSALSYAKRYALISALGLSTGEHDDDGRAAAVEYVTEEQVANLEALIEDVGAKREGFLKFLKVGSLDQLPASSYNRAVQALEKKRKG